MFRQCILCKSKRRVISCYSSNGAKSDFPFDITKLDFPFDITKLDFPCLLSLYYYQVGVLLEQQQWPRPSDDGQLAVLVRKKRILL